MSFDAVAIFQVISVLSILAFITWDGYKHDRKNPLNHAGKTDQAERNSTRDVDSNIGLASGRRLLEPEDGGGEWGHDNDADSSGLQRRIPQAKETNREPSEYSERGSVSHNDSSVGSTQAGTGWHYCTIDRIGAWKNDSDCKHGR